MTKILTNNAWEIFNIGEKNMVDIGVAMDMFVANLNNYGKEGLGFYPGAEVDYAALSAEWKALTSGEQAEEKLLYSAATRKLYDQLTAKRINGDKDGFNAVMATYEMPTEETDKEAE